MKLQFTLLLILALALGANAGLLKKCSLTGPEGGFNPVNLTENYEEAKRVDTALLQLPFKGEMRTGFLLANETSKARYFYTLYAAGGVDNADAKVDDDASLILWLQGGPGCSDASGQFTEIAPFKFINVTTNNYTYQKAIPQVHWNDNHHLLFIDNPSGVGLSVGADNVTGADQAAEYIHTFLKNFFIKYPKLATRELHVFAESFGGHYGPAIVSRLLKDPNNTINIKGLGIVDGWVDPWYQGTNYADFAYAAGLIDVRGRENLKAREVVLQQQYKNGNHTFVGESFDDPVSVITRWQGLNPYSFREYPPAQIDPFEVWLRNETVKAALGIPTAVNFTDCVDESYTMFIPNIGTSYADHYSYILSTKKVKVLVMNGADDFIVNTAGVSRFLRQLTWDGADDYLQAPKTRWFRNETVTDEWCWGWLKNSGLLTFAVVYKAGHEVPTYSPHAALNLLDRYFNNDWVQKYREE